MPNPVYTITIDPNPPQQGCGCTISYDGPEGTVLTLDWDPRAEPSQVTIGKGGQVKVTVPAAATSLIVNDPDGNTASAIVVP